MVRPAAKRKWSALIQAGSGTAETAGAVPSKPHWELPCGPSWLAVSSHHYCWERPLTAALGPLSTVGRWPGWHSSSVAEPGVPRQASFWNDSACDDDCREARLHFWTAVPSAVTATVRRRWLAFQSQPAEAVVESVWQALDAWPAEWSAAAAAPAPTAELLSDEEARAEAERARLGHSFYSCAPTPPPPPPPPFPDVSAFPGPADGIGNTFGVFRDASQYGQAVAKALNRLHARYWESAVGEGGEAEAQAHEGQAREGQAREGQAPAGEQACEGEAREGGVREGEVHRGEVREGEAREAEGEVQEGEVREGARREAEAREGEAQAREEGERRLAQVPELQEDGAVPLVTEHDGWNLYITPAGTYEGVVPAGSRAASHTADQPDARGTRFYHAKWRGRQVGTYSSKLAAAVAYAQFVESLQRPPRPPPPPCWVLPPPAITGGCAFDADVEGFGTLTLRTPAGWRVLTPDLSLPLLLDAVCVGGGASGERITFRISAPPYVQPGHLVLARLPDATSFCREDEAADMEAYQSAWRRLVAVVIPSPASAEARPSGAAWKVSFDLSVVYRKPLKAATPFAPLEATCRGCAASGSPSGPSLGVGARSVLLWSRYDMQLRLAVTLPEHATPGEFYLVRCLAMWRAATLSTVRRRR
ncbi:hypothetical protein AB1Y20_022470 [Prymnesium parvum]|uniref:AP2/ERF domain-containing protein n=1 Tax=Prymnesium parvum TaxID=97485 RepID=A0AB34JH08_PRYPA